MYVPRELIAITRPSHAEHMRDYTVVAKDEDGRVMFKYIMVIFAREGVTKHSHMRVTYSRDSRLIVPGRTYTFKMKVDKTGSAAFMLRVINELRHWEPKNR